MMTMFKVIPLVILSLLLCLIMVPLVGVGYGTTGHLHHDAATSCVVCLGSMDLLVVIFLLTCLGFATLMSLSLPPLVTPRSTFHPPRFPF